MRNGAYLPTNMRGFGVDIGGDHALELAWLGLAWFWIFDLGRAKEIWK